MPELPDIVVYIESLQTRVIGQPIKDIRLNSPFLVRTYEPPLQTVVGKSVLVLQRLGKRIVFCLNDELYLVLHLMVAGRLHWCATGTRPNRKNGLAALDFPSGSLLLTEAGSKRRASLHLVRGATALEALDPGGLEVLESDLGGFHAALTREVHTLKRALTDPHIFSGIGNAYSDEILHRARLSPLRRTDQLSSVEISRLFTVTKEVLLFWIDRLRHQTGAGFPEKVTAFREGMAVHGRYSMPCPDCGTPIQRIRYAENETNYCPACQTGGKLLADRSLSRLLREDWPRSLEELEQHRRKRPHEVARD